MTGRDGAFAQRLADLRVELDLGQARAVRVVAQMAMTVQADKVTPRDLLVAELAGLLPDDVDDRDVAEAAFVLGLDIDSTVADRLGRRRPSVEKWRQARERAERAVARLGAEHPDALRFREKAALARTLVESEKLAAIDETRALLVRRGYPASHDFLGSLRAVALAARMRMSGVPALVDEGRRVVAANVAMRTRRYGATHAFTLVARAHAVLDDLIMLELVRDERTLTASERELARGVGAEAVLLATVRTGLLGENHSATVKAISYLARAHLLQDEPEAALAKAEAALAQYVADAATQRDATLPAQLGVVIAHVLVWQRQGALRHVRAAREVRPALLARRDALLVAPDAAKRDAVERELRQADQVAAREAARAESLRSQALQVLADAMEVLGHQESLAPWTRRAEKLRAAVSG